MILHHNELLSTGCGGCFTAPCCCISQASGQADLSAPLLIMIVQECFRCC